MIQRIQSLYLLAAIILMAVGLFSPIGRFVAADGSVAGVFYNLCVKQAGGAEDFSPWALGVLLLATIVLSAVCIFSYKKRMLQTRFCIFSMLLLVGYAIAYGVFAYIIKGNMHATFAPDWRAAFPVVSIVLEYLAWRNILKDEMIVRSLDRIR
jgi:hypothetical protein